MSTWSAEDVDLPSSISELSTALQVSGAPPEATEPSSFTIAGSSTSSRPTPADPQHGPHALTLERLLGARPHRTPSPQEDHTPVTRTSARSHSLRGILGMSWPNEGIERRERTRDQIDDGDLPWSNAVETARRAGYPVAERAQAEATTGQTDDHADGAAREGPSTDRPASRQETSVTARAVRDRVRLQRYLNSAAGSAAGRGAISLGPQQVGGSPWSTYQSGSSSRNPDGGERNQRMATTLLRRRRTDDERRRDEQDRSTGSASDRTRETTRALDGNSMSRTHITYGFDPTDIEPPGGQDDHIWEMLGTLDSSSDEDERDGPGGDARLIRDRWGAFRDGAPIGDIPGSQAMLFDLFDVDGWGAAPDVGASLSRGRFNRRRQSMRGRSREGANSDQDHDRRDESYIDFSPMHAARRSFPSAADRAPSQLLVRRSRGPEDDSDSDASVEYPSTPVKRRKREVTRMAPDTSRPSYVDLTTLPVTAELPTTFESPQRSSKMGQTSFLSLTVEKRKGVWRPVVTFRPKRVSSLTNDDLDACSLRTTRPVPHGIGVHYYEVEVVNGSQQHISIGWMKDGSQRRLVGWDKGSWGWHADDGKVFEGSGEGRHFSDPWDTGDIVGCGIDMTIGRAFFTCNGKLLGHAFTSMPTGLFPAVGMRNLEESVAVNLTGPFEYDIDAHVRGVRDKIRQALHPTPEGFSDLPVQGSVPKLVGLPSPAGTASPSPSVDGTVSRDESKMSEPEALLVAKLKAKLGKGKDKAAEAETASAKSASPAVLSPLRAGPSRAAAALVLDHLAVSGFGRVRALVARDMRARGWLAPGSPEVVVPERVTPGPQTTKDDYAGAPDAIRAAVEQLSDGHVWWPLIRSFGAELGDLEHRLAVYAFAADARVAATKSADDSMDLDKTDEEDDVDMRVVAAGRDLSRRAREEHWAPEVVELLDRAAGQIVAPDDSLDAPRRADAERLERVLRDATGDPDVQRHSCLHMAVAQTGLVHEVLCERGDEAAALMGVGAVLE